MSGKILLDTNLWIYLISGRCNKSAVVKELIENNFSKIVFTTQIAGEIFNVLVKKKFKSIEEAKEIVTVLLTTFLASDVDVYKTLTAIEISQKYRYSYWDSLVLASALIEECHIVYSEDMQNNQKIERKVKIVNPFI